MGYDTIENMSAGNKALVLLKLLIELADSNYPILIDQPEDDLDNRSVYDSLIGFIRSKKINRQIIVVTHNANIVLGADADEVIVANQVLLDPSQKKRRFEYRSGSIENDHPVYKLDKTVDEGILNARGIQQHICDILEGGITAFEKRKNKYHI
jgi:predicted ATP-dependent endonuclease of OLD family